METHTSQNSIYKQSFPSVMNALRMRKGQAVYIPKPSSQLYAATALTLGEG
jgi:hypothetical protein